MMYHDHEKKLAIIHVPMQLELSTEEREKMVGDMTRAVMQSLPEDAPKGYLLQPNTALTMQGLVEQVLESEGITREMLDRERSKMTLINELASAKKEERERLLEENTDLIDESFLELLNIAGQSASQQGDSRTSLRLLNIRSHLMETTEAGARLKAREAEVQEVAELLQSKVNQQGQITRDDFVDVIVQSAGSEAKLNALAQMGAQLIDYQTLQMLSKRIEKTKDEEQKQALINARETLLNIAAEMEEQSRAVVEQAANTLRTILSAPDISAAIRQNINRIDDTFLQVLQVNLEEARRSGNVEVSSRLKQIRDEILALIQESAPPEVQFINQLMSEQQESDALAMLRNNPDKVTPQFVEVMEQLIDQLEAVGNHEAADRMRTLRGAAANMV
jgi:hypothetical protein